MGKLQAGVVAPSENGCLPLVLAHQLASARNFWLILRFGGSIGEYHPKLLCDRHLWRNFLRSRNLL